MDSDNIIYTNSPMCKFKILLHHGLNGYMSITEKNAIWDRKIV